MVRLSTRVETLKEVLQKYLDDDADMKDLNLSAKCAVPASVEQDLIYGLHSVIPQCPEGAHMQVALVPAAETSCVSGGLKRSCCGCALVFGLTGSQ